MNFPINMKNDISDLYRPNSVMKKTCNFTFIIDMFIVLLIISCLITVFFYISEDIQQGQNYKIIYLHVPSAWISLFLYIILSICSLVYLLYKNPIVKLFSRSIASIGSLFAFITLVTGSFWGLPVWGTYWVWDARLTSMFILFLFYLSYLIFDYTLKNSSQFSRTSSVIALIGAINVPIVKFSVEWWNTLHQSASITQTTSHLDFSILFLLVFIFMTIVFYTLLQALLMVRKQIIYRRIDSIYNKG